MISISTCDGSLIIFWVEIQLDFGLNSQQMWLVVGWDVYWIYFWIIPQLGKAWRISYRRLVGIFGNGWLTWTPNMCIFQTCSYSLWNKVHCSLAIPMSLCWTIYYKKNVDSSIVTNKTKFFLITLTGGVTIEIHNKMNQH